MAGNKETVIGLDVGQRRIGVALGDSIGRLAMPLTTVVVDGSEMLALRSLVHEHEVTQLVVGLPRNQSGEETQQSRLVREFVATHLIALGLPIVFQDESVTSVLAEAELRRRKKAFTKADIDAEAAFLILQDFLETHYG